MAEEERLAVEETALHEEAKLAEEERLAAEEKARNVEETKLAEEKARLEEEERLAEVERLAVEEEEARLAEEKRKTAKQEESLFQEEDWEASIRLAGELDGKEVTDDDLDLTEKDDWEAASRLAEELAAGEKDDDDDEVELSPENLTALASAAREAVEMFEALSLEDMSQREAIRQQWADEIGIQSDEEEPSDLDLEEIAMEDVDDFFDETDELADLEDLGKLARAAVDQFEASFGDDNAVEEIDDSSEAGSVADRVAATTNWSVLTVANLKAELKKRGLSATGVKAVLVAALEASDGQLEDGTSEELGDDGMEAVDLLSSESEFETEPEGAIERDSVGLLPDFESMTVIQLKEELKSRGLKVGGKKAELIERLSSA